MTVDREMAAGAALLCALGDLNERERFVFVSRTLHGLSCAAIGQQLGITRSRVDQLCRQAVGKLEHDLAPWREDLAA